MLNQINTYNRKFKKLLKNPKLFFKDAFVNYSYDEKSLFLLRKKQASYSYTIVTAVYNTEKYLPSLFESVVNQKLDFKNNIKMVLVDDGSTDSSALIIHEWAKKYPENITYIYKENGGQASARNIGLAQVRTDWVTFIDSDDFLSLDYFLQVDNYLGLHFSEDIRLVCTNQIYFRENGKFFDDIHPLNYRFGEDLSQFECSDLKQFMQFSAALAFFRTNFLPNDLFFDEKLKPTFEDAKFVNLFLLAQKSGKVIFIKNAKYFNRKRADSSSTMDNCWQHKGAYGVVLEHGYLSLLEEYLLKKGFIPVFIQRTILWEMLRLIKHLVGNKHKIDFLSLEEKNNFLELVYKVFQYIDVKTIWDFELGSMGLSRKIGILTSFKRINDFKQTVFVEKIDYEKRELLIRYFSDGKEFDQFIIDGEDTIPHHLKYADRKFLDEVFVMEKRVWLKIPKHSDELRVVINNRKAAFVLNGKKISTNLKLSAIFSDCKRALGTCCWIFMDRPDVAGDNAEYFYNYVAKNHSNKKIFFVLSKKSKDWRRLKSLNFNMIDYGSRRHKQILGVSSCLISSQAGPSLNPFAGMTSGYKTVFLQHGVIKDDLSRLLNRCAIDLFVTSSKYEYQSIARNHSPYIFGEKEVVLTGMPRYDGLLTNNKPKLIRRKRKVIIMPTWRKSIVGVIDKKSQIFRQYNNNFTKSEFYLLWRNFFESLELKKIISDFDLEVIFMPHPNLMPYVDLMVKDTPVLAMSGEVSIREVLKDADCLITDYSSIAFDFAFLEKTVLYYQPKSEIFYANHTYDYGYFDYRINGFGQVCDSEDELIIAFREVVSNEFQLLDIYKDRVEDFFEFKDQFNSRRVFDAIESLYQYPVSTKTNLEHFEKAILKAYEFEKWPLLEERSRRYLKLESAKIEFNFYLIRSLIEQRKFSEVNDLIKLAGEKNFYKKINFADLEINFAIQQHNWIEAIKYIDLSDDNSYIYQKKLMQCYAELKDLDQSHRLGKILLGQNTLKKDEIFVELMYLLCERRWDEIAKVSEDNYLLLSAREKLLYSRALRNLGLLEKCQSELTLLLQNNYCFNDVYIQLGKLAFKKNDWLNCIENLKIAYPEGAESMPADDKLFFLASQVLQRSLDSDIYYLAIKSFDSIEVLISLAKHYEIDCKWDLAIKYWEFICAESHKYNLNLAKAYTRNKDFKKAIHLIDSNDSSSSLEWLLIKREIAERSFNKVMILDIYKSILENNYSFLSEDDRRFYLSALGSFEK